MVEASCRHRPATTTAANPSGTIAGTTLLHGEVKKQSQEEHESSAKTPLAAIRSAWRELNMRTQTNLLATIIKEVVFDPDAGSIVVTLVDDAAEQIMFAKSTGSSATR